MTFSTSIASSNQIPASYPNFVKKPDIDEDNNAIQEETKLTSETAKQYIVADGLTSGSDSPASLAYPTTTASSKPQSPPEVKDKDKIGSLLPNATTSVNHSLESSGLDSLEATTDNALEMSKKNTFSAISSVIIDGHQGLEHGYIDNSGESFTPQSAGISGASENALCLSRTESDLRLDSETREVQATSVYDEDVLSFEDQRLKDPELVVDSSYLPKNYRSFRPPNSFSPQLNTSFVKDKFQIVDKNVDSISESTGAPVFYSGHRNNQVINFSSLSKNARFDNELASAGQNGDLDVGESSIISNILSLDSDSWEESLTSPQNLAKFFHENDKPSPSLGVSSPWKVQPTNQSRFSFAREEEPMNQGFDTKSSINYAEQAFRPNPYGHEFANKHLLDKFGAQNGFSSVGAEEPEGYSSHPHFSSSKLSGVLSLSHTHTCASSVA